MGFLLQRLRRGIERIRGRRWRSFAGPTATLGECPRWTADGRFVFWVDIPAGRLYRTNVATAATVSWTVGAEIAALAMRSNGELWVWVDGQIGRWDAEMARFEPSESVLDLERTTHRANDAAWAPDGSLWITTMARDGQAQTGALYRIDIGGAVRTLHHGFAIGNGPAFDSQGGWAYMVDSTQRHILRARHNDPIEFAPFVTLGPREGHLDGIATDRGGNVWVAHYGAAQISVWASSGKRLGKLHTPFPCPTAVALRYTPSDRIELAVTSAAMRGTPGGLWTCSMRSFAR